MDEVKVKKQKQDYTYAVGRRKESSARVRLYSSVRDGQVWDTQAVSKDQILVNGMPIEKYFPGPLNKAKYMQPLVLTNTVEKYAVTIKVEGGGKIGQLDALILGLSRALALANREKNRPVLKSKKLLKVDARVRERRKVGTGGKARHKKQSPKR
ncbi:MAG TPA: 30S ribosomal protein S9 [Patescibacteria group bacterium]|jgi:small subunit ribosomal protein S9|nr:30S ribosomal protein S9 [Patescibacteria group bacterium]